MTLKPAPGYAAKIYIVPDEAQRSWKLVVHNTGSQVVGVTQNILRGMQEAGKRVHDDHVQFGHGMTCQPGAVSWLEFKEGTTYRHQGGRGGSHIIGERSAIRVGLRGACHKTVPLPPLNGAPLELDLQDFIWYGQRAETSMMDSYANQASNPINRNVSNGASLIAEIQKLTAMKNLGVNIEGEVRVVAKEGEHGELSHWELWFDNNGDGAWIGTAVFEGAEKNDGIGLESMGVPKKGSQAMQRIEALGNYGVSAEPGKKIRVGVRGYGHTTLTLPGGGETKADLSTLTVASSQMSKEFFDEALVKQKRQEKLDKVQFFDGGKAANAELKPVVYEGAEAIARADYNPPKVTVEVKGDSAEYPGGGWLIQVTNTLPKKSKDGLLGVVTTLKLGAVGVCPEVLPPAKLSKPGQVETWFLPRGIEANGFVAKRGQTLTLTARGTGYFIDLSLPAKGNELSTEEDVSAWRYRDDKFNRRQLSHEFLESCLF